MVVVEKTFHWLAPHDFIHTKRTLSKPIFEVIKPLFSYIAPPYNANYNIYKSIKAVS